MLYIIKKIVKLLLFSVMIASPHLVFADSTVKQSVAAIDAVSIPSSPMITSALPEDILTPLPQFKSVDEAFEPLQNRILLSLFGREATVAALSGRLSQSLKEDIISLDNSRVAELVDPFPSSAVVVVSLVFRVLYIVAFSFWVYMFSSYIFNRLFSKHAEDLEGATVRMGVIITSLRSFAVMALCVPIFSDKLYSQAHMVGFKMIGVALDYAQRIDDKFSVQQKVGGSRYFVPKPSWVTQYSGGFIDGVKDFSNCVVRSGMSASDVKYGSAKLITPEKCLKGTGGDSCNKNIEMNINTGDHNVCSLRVGQTIPDGDIYNAVSESHGGFNVGIKKFDAVALKAFVGSVHTIVNSSVNTAFDAVNSRTDININGELTSSAVFSDTGWFRKCDLNTNAEIKKQIADAKSLGDLKAAIVNEELCQSAYLVKRYGYPTENYAKDPSSDQMSRSVNLCSGSGISSIDVCAMKICSSISDSGVTGLFSCADASVNAGAYYKTGMIRKMGFIVSPALAAADIRGLDVPISIQSLLTSWYAFSGQTSGSFPRFKDDKATRSLNKRADAVFNTGTGLSSESSHLGNLLRSSSAGAGTTETFGFNRFYGCISGGGEYTDDGVPVACSSSLSEIHRFGMHLLKGWAAMQIGGLSRGVANKIKDHYKEKKSKDSDNGDVDNGKENKPDHSGVNVLKAKMSGFIGDLRTVVPLGIAFGVATMLVDHKATSQMFGSGGKAVHRTVIWMGVPMVRGGTDRKSVV